VDYGGDNVNSSDWLAPDTLSGAVTITPSGGDNAASAAFVVTVTARVPLTATAPVPAKVKAGVNALNAPVPGIAAPAPFVPK
jgi:hypothetical protein